MSIFRKKTSISAAGGGGGGGGGGSGGSLNSNQQLEAAYAGLLKNEGADEAWRKEIFQKVRILVLGRSGVGKTTLIRLLVGQHGPQSVSEGCAGVQNINKEFLYSSEEQGVPLIVHDSNGMDVRGQERVKEIKGFIDKHQKSGDFTERIHVVWYIISAIDPRCLDDCDVMRMISEYKIPSLLIMTHSDHEKVKVTEAVLNRLLQNAYSVEAERENVKKRMVRVCNDGVSVGANNELVIDESKRDTKGLKLVARSTALLMDKKLRNTWITAQAVDLEGKLDKSAAIIAGYARRALLTSLPRVIPLADPLKLAIIFWRVTVIMCQIWVVPPELKEALKATFNKEASCRVLRRIVQDTGVLLEAAITGLLPAMIRSWRKSGNAVTVVVKTFSLQVLGTILYAKSAQAGSCSKHEWRQGVSKDEYRRLCEEFAHNVDHQNKFLDFARKQHSTLDTAVRNGKVKGMMKSQIVELYRRLLKDQAQAQAQARNIENFDNNSTASSATVRDPNIDQRLDNTDNIENFHNNSTASSVAVRYPNQRLDTTDNIENVHNNSIASSTAIRYPNQRLDTTGNIENFHNNSTASSTVVRYPNQRLDMTNNIRNFHNNSIASSATARYPNQRLDTTGNIENFHNNSVASSAAVCYSNQQLATTSNIENFHNNSIASSAAVRCSNQRLDTTVNVINFNNNSTASSAIIRDPNIDQQLYTTDNIENFNDNSTPSFIARDPNIDQGLADNIENFKDNNFAIFATGDPSIDQKLGIHDTTGNFHNNSIASSTAVRYPNQRLDTTGNIRNYHNNSIASFATVRYPNQRLDTTGNIHNDENINSVACEEEDEYDEIDEAEDDDIF